MYMDASLKTDYCIDHDQHWDDQAYMPPLLNFSQLLVQATLPVQTSLPMIHVGNDDLPSIQSRWTVRPQSSHLSLELWDYEIRFLQTTAVQVFKGLEVEKTDQSVLLTETFTQIMTSFMAD